MTSRPGFVRRMNSSVRLSSSSERSDKVALVVEPGHTEACLAAVRALSAHGWRVGVAAPQVTGGLAAASRAVSRTHLVTAANDDIDGFIDGVNAAIATGGYKVVLPGSDANALALSMRRDRLKACIPLGPHDSVLGSQDKLSLVRAARTANIATPATVCADRWRDLPQRQIYVVKARLHAPLQADSSPRHVPGAIVERAGVETAIERVKLAGGAPVVQEHVEGILMSVAFVADQSSRIVAALQQISETTWPPDGGVATRAKSIPLDNKLLERIQRLVSELSWSGLAQLQFLVDPHRGPLLIDFNGRFYLSLALAGAAGQNLAAIWASLAVGIAPPIQPSYRTGVRWQWLVGDLLRAQRERRGGLIRDVATTIRYPIGAVRSTWDIHDAGPTMAKLGWLARRAYARIA